MATFLNHKIAVSERKKAAKALRLKLETAGTKGMTVSAVQVMIKTTLGITDQKTYVGGRALAHILSWSGAKKLVPDGEKPKIYFLKKYHPEQLREKKKAPTTKAKATKNVLTFSNVQITIHGVGITKAKVKQVIITFCLMFCALGAIALFP